ncbi:WD40 repeat domain-containing protein [Nonomuraea sp. CA-143628]|uniref:WD40 repeat domain-containing protein n=1 Tax=Nonomuraea sp. CA-143628 TaxID=3239997 RepID=UPI003D90D077
MDLLDAGDPAGPPVLTLEHIYQHLARRLPEKGLPLPRRQMFDLGGTEPIASNLAYQAPKVPPVPSRIPDSDGSPYRGLASYGVQDARFFFGRDSLTRELAERISTTTSDDGPVLVTGSSGSGKSSLLRAGLVPALRAADPRARALILTPGSDPLTNLLRRIAALGRGPAMPEESIAQLVTQTEDDPAAVDRLLREAVAANPYVNRLYVIVDQFEETFTDCMDEHQRRRFIAAVAAITECVVIIALRSDFFSHCADHPELRATMASPFIVGAMDTAELRDVIEKPAKAKGLALEPGLMQLLLEDLGPHGQAPGVHSNLPLLSHALLVTWQHRAGDVLTLAGYRATGGIAKAIANTADEVVAQLGASRDLLIRRMMLRLVRLGEGTEDTRRSVVLDELLPHMEPGIRGEAELVLREFVSARLITVDGDIASIAHEALLRYWPTLRSWIDNDRAGELIRQRLQDAAETWFEGGRHPSLLDRGPRLDNALAWAEARTGDLDPRTQVFLDASVKSRDAERRLDRKRVVLRRWAIAGLALLAVLASAGGGIALKLQADTQREQIMTLSRQVAFRADAVRPRDPALAAQLSLVSYRISPTEEARNSLLSASGTPTAIRLRGHAGPVLSVSFRPDGRFIASAGADNTVRFWDVAGQREVARLKEPQLLHGSIYEVAWSGDGRFVLIHYRGDAPSQVWNVNNLTAPKYIGALAQTTGAWTTAVRHDGRVLATGGPSGPTFLFDDRTPGKAAAKLGGISTGGSWYMAFSPNGQTLLVTQTSWYAELWDVRDPHHPVSYTPLRDSAGAVSGAFSSDGTKLAVGNLLDSLTIFDVRNPAEPKKVTNLKLDQKTSDQPASLSFAPDGSLLAAAYTNEDVVRIWDVAAKHVVYTLPQVGQSQSVDFSPLGDTVATAGDDGIVRIWTLQKWPIGSHSDLPNTITFSSDGRTLASSGRDGVRVWEVTQDHGLRSTATLDVATTNSIWSVLAFNKNGDRLYSSADIGRTLYDTSNKKKISAIGQGVSVDFADAAGLAIARNGKLLALGAQPFGGTGSTLPESIPLHLWSLNARGRLDRRLSTINLGQGDSPSAPVSLAMTSTGHTLIGGIDDGSIRIWDISNPARPRNISRLAVSQHSLNGLAIDPSDKMLAVAADDQPVRLWNVSNPALPVSMGALPSNPGRALKLAFDRSGQFLAVIGEDRSIRIFDLTGDRRLVMTLQAHEGPVRGITFSPADEILASVSEDNTVRLWDLNEERVARRICALSFTPISKEEWQRYVIGLSYSPPCKNGKPTSATD